MQVSTFYIVTDDEIDVWRILHIRRDVPVTLEPPDS
jgi:plasmid stabilization system protein ParE